MHDGELDIEADLVADLLAAQFPKLVDLPIRASASTGTVNAIFRIGDELYARLPRKPAWADDLEYEWQWLPTLASQLPLAIPEPIAKGRPTKGYPAPWAIYRWIEGEPYTDAVVNDEEQAADDLAGFVAALRRLDVADAPRAGRKPIRELDAETREAIRAGDGVIDAARAMDAWSRALDAPVWDGRPAWIHSDLLRPNLLVRDGRIRAVIDWGAAGVGDPAMDVIPAWAVFGARGRAKFREALEVDDGIWERARGIALHQAALIVPYYTLTNPEFVTMARRTIDEGIRDCAD